MSYNNECRFSVHGEIKLVITQEPRLWPMFFRINIEYDRIKTTVFPGICGGQGGNNSVPMVQFAAGVERFCWMRIVYQTDSSVKGRGQS
jgi:hypothetical protein